jgi:Protein of unknown function (DUF2971)
VDDDDVIALFTPQFDNFQNLASSAVRPLLAHYTSIDVLEKIMKHEELWFSNPLNMNDWQEMHFGMSTGLEVFERYCREPSFVTAAGSSDRAERLRIAFEGHFATFEIEQALDIYVFCLSEHDAANADGRLSMWRAYGGQGNGAALIFKSDFVALQPASPLLFARVAYASNDDRIAWIRQKFETCMAIVAAGDIPYDMLDLVAKQMFQLMKLYALTSKHPGFDEEREWRIIYFPDRDKGRLLLDKLGYAVAKKGIEPKLKLKIAPLPIRPLGTWTFDSILAQIILGPTQSSALAMKSVCRMLDLNGKSNFKARVSASQIPLRPAIR